MPVPESAVGTTTAPLSVIVERSRLRLFAKATGQTDPLYTDVETARSQGHPDLPVPPTYLFGLELEQPEPFSWLTDLGVELSSVLHGAQSFTYDGVAHAGDTLTVCSTVTGLHDKKGGAMQLIDRTSIVTRGHEKIATLAQTIVVVGK